MGPEAAMPIQNPYPVPYSNDVYLPVSSSRVEEDRGILPLPSTTSKKSGSNSRKLITPPFAGLWAIAYPSSITPCSRMGHFSVFDQNTHTVYIGYGIADGSGQLMDDCWALNTLTHQWRQIPLKGNTLPPRTGCRASLIGNHILVFGGYSSPNYLSDLHTIDITNGIVELVKTNGNGPSPRTSPIVTIYDNKFYVWGGFNEQWPSSLHVLDFSNWTWTEYPTDVKGRTNVPFVRLGHILYTYGGSKSGGFVEIDLKNFKVSVVQTKGAEPPSSVMGSGMVDVEGLLIFFGGQASSNWTLMYACDVKKNWWFVFHVLPDGETVTLSDGIISDNGLFMLPRLHGFGVAYEKKTKEIIAYLGAPEKTTSPLFIVKVGPALSMINLRNDMLDILHYDL